MLSVSNISKQTQMKLKPKQDLSLTQKNSFVQSLATNQQPRACCLLQQISVHYPPQPKIYDQRFSISKLMSKIYRTGGEDDKGKKDSKEQTW